MPLVLRRARVSAFVSLALGTAAAAWIGCGGDDAVDTGSGDAATSDGSMGSDAASGDGATTDGTTGDAAPSDGGTQDATDGATPLIPCGDSGLGAPGNVLQVQSFGTANGSIGSFATATDAAGNVYLTGSIAGTVDFGGGGLVADGAGDAFLAKFDAAGNHVWSKVFNAAMHQSGFGVVVDATGNIYVAGYFYGSINLAGTGDAGAENLSVPGSKSAGFVAKFDPNGGHLWSHQFGDGTSYEIPQAIALGPQNDVIIGGNLQGTVPFALADGGTTNLVGSGANDAFVARYATDGSPLWARRWGDANDQDIDSVAVDPDGNILLAGTFHATADFSDGDGGAAALTSTTPNKYAAYVAKLTATGDYVWSHGFGSGNSYQGDAVAAASATGSVYLAASIEGDTNPSGVDGGTMTGHGTLDLYVVKFGKDGSYQWARQYGDPDLQYAAAVVPRPDDSVSVVGTYRGVVDIEDTNDASTHALTSNGYDILAFQLDKDGAPVWSRSFGAAGDQKGYSAAAIGCGALVMSGAYGAPFSFPNPADGGEFPVTPGTGDQGYFAKIAP